ncbi:MAG: DNA polymerase III subunit delta' [Ideonella sp.]|nr:DNA polymerase III subunit delta' [Ideonella sp.]
MGVAEDGSLPLPWLGDALTRALALARSHAVLLHAPTAVGQIDLALVLAQAWLCEQAAAVPCGQCRSCRLVRQRAHPDLRIVVPEVLRHARGWLVEDDPLLKAGAKPSREVKVEAVRQAIDWSQRSAGSPRGRALVIAPAEALNAASASALLKTLEEPPGGLRIALAGTDPERLLPTLRSRVQRVALSLPPADTSLAWLRSRGHAASTQLLTVAGGSPLATEALIEAGLDDGVLMLLPKAVARGDAGALVGKPLPLVIDLLLRLAHDAMAQAVGAAPRHFAAAAMPPRAALPALQSWQRELLRAARHDEHPWNTALLVEALVTNGARCWPAPAAANRRAAGHSLHSTG